MFKSTRLPEKFVEINFFFFERIICLSNPEETLEYFMFLNWIFVENGSGYYTMGEFQEYFLRIDN